MSGQPVERLSLINRALHEAGYELTKDQTDRFFRSCAVNCQIPAHQVNGRWHFRRDDLPEIVKALGLRKARQTAAA